MQRSASVVNGNGYAKSPASPLWAKLLLVLGWIVAVGSGPIGVEAGFQLATLLGKVTNGVEVAAIVLVGLATGVMNFGIGLILIVISRVGRRRGRTAPL